MNYREIYGKMWDYTPRQWRNLGLQFEKETTYLKPEYVVECLEEDGRNMGNMLMFVQIMLLKSEIHNNNSYIQEGVRPELLYDRWTWKTTKLHDYVRDDTGNIKESIKSRAQTHIFNCYKTWMKQLMYEIKNRVGRYDYRTNDMHEKTTFLEPERMTKWLDEYSENWMEQWVYDPTEMTDEAQEDTEETNL